MIQLVMSAALLLLAAVRVPALLRNRSDLVFLAAVFAGLAALLMSPIVYVPVDTVAGGINLTKLAIQSLMVLGLWHLHLAVLEGIAPGADRRPALVRSLPLTATLALQTTFFFLTGPTTTTTTWGIYVVDRLFGLLFSVMVTGFVAWICGGITIACIRYVPKMRRAFRIGFSMVGLGAAIACVAMGHMTLSLLVFHIPALVGLLNPDGFPYSLMEMASIVLVGVGLTIPVVAGKRERRNRLRWNNATIARIEPIREKALRNASLDRTLGAGPGSPIQDKLHRMIVEVWDAELAAGPSGTSLTPEERSYLLSVEEKLHASATKA